MRTILGATLVALMAFSAASATELKGTIKSVDKKTGSIVLTVDGKDKKFSVSKDASIVTVSQVPGKKGMTMEKLTPIDNGLEGVKTGATATLLTDKVDDKETVTSVKVSDGSTAGKKKKKKKT